MKRHLKSSEARVTISPMDASKVIDALGGATATAKLCEVTPQAASLWKKRGFPRIVEKYLRLLRPAAFKVK